MIFKHLGDADQLGRRDAGAGAELNVKIRVKDVQALSILISELYRDCDISPDLPKRSRRVTLGRGFGTFMG